MSTYEFTLVVDRMPTDDEVDALFDATQGDSVPEGGGAGPNLVHVHRPADSLADAIADAVHTVEAVGLSVTGVQSDDLVSLKDIAARCGGRSYEWVRKYATGERGSGAFPAALSTGHWSLYSWVEVSRWLAEHSPTAPGGCSVYDREIAAADYALRARRLLVDDDSGRAGIARLISA